MDEDLERTERHLRWQFFGVGIIIGLLIVSLALILVEIFS